MFNWIVSNTYQYLDLFNIDELLDGLDWNRTVCKLVHARLKMLSAKCDEKSYF